MAKYITNIFVFISKAASANSLLLISLSFWVVDRVFIV